MKKILILCSLVVLLGGLLAVSLMMRAGSSGAHASGGGTVIFQDNFDSYTAGPLPTGTGANQWTAVKTAGTGFAVAVTNTESVSPPNSLQITLGSGLKGHAYTEKNYAGTGYAQHTVTFELYLDPSLNLGGQPIPVFTAENHARPADGSAAVWLSAGKRLQVIRYDSTGKKHVASTTSALLVGQWYSIELDQTNDALNGSWALFLNGTQIAGGTSVDTGNTLVDTILAGDSLASTVALSGSMYLDDVVTSTTSTTPPPAIFQDNFDSYTSGPLPTGTGANQWTAVKTAGTGFAVAVTNTEFVSPPNSLQITLGSGSKGLAFARKDYGSTGYATHKATFKLYLGGNLNQGGQSVAVFTAENHVHTTNGSIAVWLTASERLQIVRFDSTGKKYVITTNKLSLGQWYSIELDQTNDALNGSWALFLNGTQIAGGTSVDTGNTLVDTILAGDTQPSANTMSGSYYLDDVLTSS